MNGGFRASDVPAVRRARAYLLALVVTAVAVTATLPLQRTFDRFPYLPLLVAAVIISTWMPRCDAEKRTPVRSVRYASAAGEWG